MDKSATNEVSITKITIKKENINDEIKEFAETAMNELLGWYGYENPRDDSRNNRTCRSHSESNSSGPESPKYTEVCGWCGKPVDETTGLTSAVATFCSELCFSQSRRANFKKNKTCDWCRHVRHTVSYVDFQDGASQLQFCSDKCLNQYKMHIFCRETRAHLELHPHLHGDETSGGTLITPDLWMKNCKSPNTRSPSPTISPKLKESPLQTSPLPLITIAHPSKLLGPSSIENKRIRIKNQKKSRKRCPSTVTLHNLSKLSPNDLPQDLRIRHSPVDFDSSAETTEHTSTQEEEIPNICSPRLQNNTNDFRPTNNPTSTKDAAPKKPMESLIPPPTILIPYPIILPLPIPIPIPIPIPNLLKKLEQMRSVDTSTQTDELPVDNTVDSSQNNEEEIPEVKTVVGRPLRNRKRIFPEPTKPKYVKNKKVASN